MIGEGGTSTWLDIPQADSKQTAAKKRKHKLEKMEEGIDGKFRFVPFTYHFMHCILNI